MEMLLEDDESGRWTSASQYSLAREIKKEKKKGKITESVDTQVTTHDNVYGCGY